MIDSFDTQSENCINLFTSTCTVSDAYSFLCTYRMLATLFIAS
jgi:hypothetical protein